MARANNGGWDFVKVGGTYQYKEDYLLAVVEVLEDNSDEQYYRFLLRPLRASGFNIGPTPFEISFVKDLTGAYSGQAQLYEHKEYIMLPLGSPWPYNYEEGYNDQEI